MKQESTMLFTNACIENKTELQDIRVKNGLFAEIGTKLLPEAGENVTDLQGRLVLPPRVRDELLFGEKDVEITGANDHVRVIAASHAVQAKKDFRAALPNILKRMAELEAQMNSH